MNISPLRSIVFNKLDNSRPGTHDILRGMVLAFPAVLIWSFINILCFPALNYFYNLLGNFTPDLSGFFGSLWGETQKKSLKI